MSLEMVNSTVSAVSSFSDVSFGWLIGILAFIVICLTLFFLLKSFRKFVIGIVPTIGIIVIIFVSKYIGASAGSGDLSPAKWLCYFVAFVVVSILIGHILAKKSKIVREMFEVEEEEKGK